MRYPEYKTQIEIAREQKARYDALVGFGDGGTYEDINYQPITHDDRVWFFKEKAFPKQWPQPWRWIALLAVAIILCIIEYCT